MSFRTILSVITLIVLGVLIWLAWPEITDAVGYLGQVDLWILALLIPVQIISFWSTGETFLSYLRARGALKNVNPFTSVRLSLEYNFVNNLFPSGGAAGISYMGWKLGHYGVRPGQSTMAQLVRFAVTFASFLILLAISVVFLMFSGNASPLVLWMSAGIGVAAIGATIGVIVIISKESRLHTVAGGLTGFVNGLVRIVTLGRKTDALDRSVLDKFFTDLHLDYVELLKDRRVLIKPFLWSFVLNVSDVALFAITFVALGSWADPATLFIAFGLSSVASILVFTPNGAGAYEAIMIGFLVAGGLAPDVAIAGVLLARVVLLLATILFGYAFYQHTILKYGKAPIGKDARPAPTGQSSTSAVLHEAAGHAEAGTIDTDAADAAAGSAGAAGAPKPTKAPKTPKA